jgi:hypothetical protein
MPFKSEYTHKKIPRELDRRVKLSLEDREKVKVYYKQVKSERKTAVHFGVSRRLIQFILDPEKKVRDLHLRQLRGGSKIYYDKEKQVTGSRETRAFRKQLDKENKLTDEK